jgi:hypothetical protein
VQSQAEAFARRLIQSASDPRRRVELAYELAWSRSASPAEVERGRWYIAQYSQPLTSMGLTEVQAAQAAWTSFARVMMSANEFVYLD